MVIFCRMGLIDYRAAYIRSVAEWLLHASSCEVLQSSVDSSVASFCMICMLNTDPSSNVLNLDEEIYPTLTVFSNEAWFHRSACARSYSRPSGTGRQKIPYESMKCHFITMGVWCAMSATRIIRLISLWCHKFTPVCYTHIVTQFLITSPITRAPMLKCALIIGLVEREMYTAMKLHLPQKCGVRNLNRS